MDDLENDEGYKNLKIAQEFVDLINMTAMDRSLTPVESNGSSGSTGAFYPPESFLGVFNPLVDGDHFLLIPFGGPFCQIRQSSSLIFGDKLYGNQEHRDTLLPELFSRFGVGLGHRDAFTIDEYNKLCGFSGGEMDLGESLHAGEFFRFISLFLGEGNCESDSIRKACKKGVDFTLDKGRRVHFILSNRIKRNMVGIAKKVGEHSDSITSSELRYLFRNWDRFKGYVIFYDEEMGSKGKKLVPTLAPWETDPTPWEECLAQDSDFE